MTIPNKPQPPEAADDQQQSPPADQESGTNAVEHEPDPSADHKPDSEGRYIKRSPYTTGNY